MFVFIVDERIAISKLVYKLLTWCWFYVKRINSKNWKLNSTDTAKQTKPSKMGLFSFC